MELKLEPMTVGQILDKAFRLYSKNFLRFITIVAVVQVPLFLVQLPIGKAAADEAVAQALHPGSGGSGLWALVGLSALVGLFGQALCSAALVKGISGAYLDQPASVGSAYRQVLPKIVSLVGASILVALVVGVGFVLLIVPGIILMTMYALTTPAIVCEDMGAFKGMTRSGKLTKGNKGKVFAVLVVVGLLTWVISPLKKAS